MGLWTNEPLIKLNARGVQRTLSKSFDITAVKIDIY